MGDKSIVVVRISRVVGTAAVVVVAVDGVVVVDAAVVVVVADTLYPYTNRYHRHKQNNSYHKDFVQIVEYLIVVLVIVLVAVDVVEMNVVGV